MLARDSDISESGDEVGIDTALLDMIIARAPGNRKWKLILTPSECFRRASTAPTCAVPLLLVRVADCRSSLMRCC